MTGNVRLTNQHEPVSQPEGQVYKIASGLERYANTVNKYKIQNTCYRAT